MRRRDRWTLGICVWLVLATLGSGSQAKDKPRRKAAPPAEAVAESAQDEPPLEEQLSPEELAAFKRIVELDQSLDKRAGTVSLGNDLATLNLPEGYRYLGPEDTEKVLVYRAVWRHVVGGDCQLQRRWSRQRR